MKVALWSILGAALFIGLPVLLAVCLAPSTEIPISGQAFDYKIANRFINYFVLRLFVFVMLFFAGLARLAGVRILNWLGRHWWLMILIFVLNSIICECVDPTPTVHGLLSDMEFGLVIGPYGELAGNAITAAGACLISTAVLLWLVALKRGTAFSFGKKEDFLEVSLLFWGYLVGAASSMFHALEFAD